MTNELITKWDKDIKLSPEQIELIKNTVAKNATDNELALFLYIAKNYELDPFLKEICFITRRVYNPYKKDYDIVPSIMTTRDGFLSIAHRSQKFDGMETEAIYDDKGKLLGAKCTVYRKDMSHPFKVEVKFEEYCVYTTKDGQRTPQALWGSKGESMIKKVAESQALRKAFDIHGLYAQEEMESEIAKEAKEEVEVANEILDISKKFYITEGENYEKWSEDFLTKALDELDNIIEDKALWTWEKKNEQDISHLTEKDRQYLQDELENALSRIITGKPPEPPQTAEEGKRDAGADSVAGSGDLQGKVDLLVKDGISETPKTEFFSLEAQEKDNKEWFKKAVAEIQACKNVIVLKDWAQKNSINIKALLTELREALEVYYKAQWDKVRIGYQIKYRFL